MPQSKDTTKQNAKKSTRIMQKPTLGERLKSFVITIGGMGFGLLVFIALGWMPTFEIPGVTMTRANFESEQEISGRLKLPDGYRLNLYAAGLGRSRAMALTPTGDLLITVPGRKLLLVKADQDGDGRSDGTETLLEDLNSGHGLVLDGGWLYVAESGGVVRMRYNAAKRQIEGEREILTSQIPTGGAHWTRTIKRGPDGWFYVSVGSTCNVCIERHPWRASMLRFKPGKEPEMFASGLRNTVGYDWQPGTGRLYGVDNGRDWLGDDMPPEEVNLIEQNGFYGWPFLHGDNLADPEYGKVGGDAVKRAIKPIYGLDAHSAPLALTFLRNQKAPDMKNTALVTQHGSWNRSSRSGYQVVSLSWDAAGAITERPFLTGFVLDEDVVGRPVDVVETGDGTIFISDDLSGVVWRVVYADAT